MSSKLLLDDHPNVEAYSLESLIPQREETVPAPRILVFILTRAFPTVTPRVLICLRSERV